MPSLRAIRVRRALSQRELARAAGLNKDTIRRLEAHRAEAQFDTLPRLAAGLGCEPADLMAEPNDTSAHIVASDVAPSKARPFSTLPKA